MSKRQQKRHQDGSTLSSTLGCLVFVIILLRGAMGGRRDEHYWWYDGDGWLKTS